MFSFKYMFLTKLMRLTLIAWLFCICPSVVLALESFRMPQVSNFTGAEGEPTSNQFLNIFGKDGKIYFFEPQSNGRGYAMYSFDEFLPGSIERIGGDFDQPGFFTANIGPFCKPAANDRIYPLNFVMDSGISINEEMHSCQIPYHDNHRETDYSGSAMFSSGKTAV